jgi:predicted CXXCH cytochrome family protein
MNWRLVATIAVAVFALRSQDAARIMRPVDGAALPRGTVDIIAGGVEASLEIDGKSVEAERPFPGVLRAKPSVADGAHKLALIWKEGRKEIRFFVGPNFTAEYAAYKEHPPSPGVPCTKCHEVNTRGRFRFKGGCFDCHAQEAFTKVHTHVPDTLSQCGSCHNPHGSTTKAHLIVTKEAACKQCHD